MEQMSRLAVGGCDDGFCWFEGYAVGCEEGDCDAPDNVFKTLAQL